MTEQHFTTKDILKILDISMSRLRTWLLNGYITPSVPSSGQGKKALFTKEDIYAIYLFKELIESKGLKREAAARFIRECQADPSRLTFASFLLFVVTKDVATGTEDVKFKSFSGEESVGLRFYIDKIYKAEIGLDEGTDLGDFLWEEARVINFSLIKAVLNSKMKL